MAINAEQENISTEVGLPYEESASSEQHSEQPTQHITLFAEPIAHFGSFTLTNALLTSWVAVAVIIILAVALRSKLREIPSGIQNLFEIIVEGALGMCDQVTGNRALSMRIFPVAISVFFFILVNNWLGLLPLGGFGIVEQGEHGLSFVPFLRGGTADINTTLALAFMAVLGANIFGIFSIGLWKTFNKYVNLKVLGSIFTKIRHEPTVIIVAPITFFVGLIEIVGEFAKIASLSFRLFGNVFAGEVLLVVITFLVPVLLPVPFLGLEVFVGFIQALVFTMLTTIFIVVATQHHEGGEH